MAAKAVALGAHILDVLGRYVTEIPEGQGGTLIEEIRVTPAGAAGGTAITLAKLGFEVTSAGAIGRDDLGDMLVNGLERFGVDCSQHQQTWSELLDRVQFAESAGFDGAWIFDHFTPLYGGAVGELRLQSLPMTIQ